MKAIRFEALKGTFAIPLESVAKNRASYYANKEGHEEGSQDYWDEVQYVMEDDFEGIDWLINNTNYEDWTDELIHIGFKKIADEDDFWCDSSYFEIIEINTEN